MIIRKNWKDVVQDPPSNELDSVEMTVGRDQFYILLEGLYYLSRQHPDGTENSMEYLKQIVDLYYDMKC